MQGLAALTFLCLLSSIARADDVEDARRHVRNGSRAFELGQFDEAIHEYTAAYKLKSVPAILYNLAQAHRLANHPSEALHFYKMFLTKFPEAPNRDEVTAKIDTLVKLVEQQRRPPDDEVAPPKAVAPSVPVVVTPVALPARKEKPIRKRAWVWGVIGAVVAAGVGIGLGIGLGTQSHAPIATEGTVRF